MFSYFNCNVKFVLFRFIGIRFWQRTSTFFLTPNTFLKYPHFSIYAARVNYDFLVRTTEKSRKLAPQKKSKQKWKLPQSFYQIFVFVFKYSIQSPPSGHLLPLLFIQDIFLHPPPHALIKSVNKRQKSLPKIPPWCQNFTWLWTTWYPQRSFSATWWPNSKWAFQGT